MSPVSDLDLAAVHDRFEAACTALTSITFSTPELTTAVMDSLGDVPRLAAELERAGRLLGAESFPTSDGYEAMAAALTDMRGLVVEILRHFPPIDDPDLRDSVRSGLVQEVTVARWRRIANGSSDV